MKNLKDLTYGFVGLGLMGGSIAKAIRANILDIAESSGKIFAYDKNEASLKKALENNIVDKVFIEGEQNKMLGDCDIVFICLYPHATLKFIQENNGHFKKDCIITDISGVKTFLYESLKDFDFHGADFIFGHPMAGNEKEGYINSSDEVFVNRNYILMTSEKNKKENIELLKELIMSLGFGRIIETDCKTHDHKIAFTSQLCHVIACSLVDSAEDERITEFGGGSYEDLTRIALINAPLWTELFLSNKEELLLHLEEFEKSLGKIKSCIQKSDAEGLEDVLQNVRTKRISMSRI